MFVHEHTNKVSIIKSVEKLNTVADSSVIRDYAHVPANKVGVIKSEEYSNTVTDTCRITKIT